MSHGSETTHTEDDNHHNTDTNVEEPNINSRTPLLKTSTLRHSSISHAVSLLFQDWWLWEFVGASIAVISIVVIFVILLLYDSSSLPDWPFIFTVGSLWLSLWLCAEAVQINSVISFFGTIAKLSLGSIVGAAISQSKWFWFRQGQPRHLQDLQLFDDASRGPIGAAQLMINLRFR